jgi:type IV pilus assembly protein PilA
MKVSVSRSRSRAGFTLIELLMTCAIIGVLAAIAIPNFFAYQARARRSEGSVQVAGIARAYIAYHAESGKFPDILSDPDGGVASLPNFTVLGPQKLPWDAAAKKFFDLVGYQAEGNVWHTYEVNSDCSPALGGGGTCDDQSCFTVIAHGDVDGNGLQGAVMYVHPSRDPAGNVLAYCGSDIPGITYTVPIELGSGDPIFDQAAIYNTDPY